MDRQERSLPPSSFPVSYLQISENTKHLLDRDGSFNYVKRENRPAACGNIETYWLIGRNSVTVARCTDPTLIHCDNSQIQCHSSLIHSSNSLIHYGKEGTFLESSRHKNQGLLIHEPLRSLTMSRSGISPKSGKLENAILGSMDESEEEEEDFGYDSFCM